MTFEIHAGLRKNLQPARLASTADRPCPQRPFNRLTQDVRHRAPGFLPPAPWHLRGDAIFVLKMVPVEVARAFVPASTPIASVSGRTLAALYLATYAAGSTLQYRELIVVPGFVRHHGRTGAWISHIQVDSHASAAAGRSIWGLPKEAAQFAWTQTSISVAHPRLRLEVSRVQGRGGVLPLPLIAPAFGHQFDEFKFFAARGWGRIARIRGSVALSDDYGLRALGFGDAKTLWSLADLHLTVQAPWKIRG